MLGSGVAGTVFLATTPGDAHEVAVKVFPASEQSSAEQEAKLLRMVHDGSSSCCIVQAQHVLYSVCWTGLVLDYFPAGSLQDRICALGPGQLLPNGTVEDIAYDMLSGLASIHRCCVVHLDVKKDNVMLTAAGGAKWIDLGEAQELGEAGVLSPEDFDPMPYPFTRRAPEVWSQELFGTPADVWAAGSIIAEMFTLHNILLGSDQQEQQALVQEVTTKLSLLREEGELSDPQYELLSALLETDPNRRSTAEAALGLPFFAACRERRQQGTPKRKVLKAHRPKA